MPVSKKKPQSKKRQPKKKVSRQKQKQKQKQNVRVNVSTSSGGAGGGFLPIPMQAPPIQQDTLSILQSLGPLLGGVRPPMMEGVGPEVMPTVRATEKISSEAGIRRIPAPPPSAPPSGVIPLASKIEEQRKYEKLLADEAKRLAEFKAERERIIPIKTKESPIAEIRSSVEPPIAEIKSLYEPAESSKKVVIRESKSLSHHKAKGTIPSVGGIGGGAKTHFEEDSYGRIHPIGGGAKMHFSEEPSFKKPMVLPSPSKFAPKKPAVVKPIKDIYGRPQASFVGEGDYPLSTGNYDASSSGYESDPHKRLTHKKKTGIVSYLDLPSSGETEEESARKVFGRSYVGGGFV